MAMKWRRGGVVVSALDLRLVVRDLDSVVHAVSLGKTLCSKFVLHPDKRVPVTCWWGKVGLASHTGASGVSSNVHPTETGLSSGPAPARYATSGFCASLHTREILNIFRVTVIGKRVGIWENKEWVWEQEPPYVLPLRFRVILDL